MKSKYQFLFLIAFLVMIVSGVLGWGTSYLIPTPDYSLVNFNDTICFGCDEIYDPSIITLLTIIIPIAIVLGLLVRYLPSKEKGVEYVN